MKRFLGPHGLIGVVLVSAPMAFGSVHPLARTTIGVLVCIAVMWLFALRARRPRPDAAGWGLIVALTWTLLQMVPLPLSAATATANDTVNAALALGGTASSAPLTLDVGASAELAWYLATALGLYLVVLHSAPRHRRLVLQSIACAGVMMVLVGVTHRVTHATSLFGVYAPTIDLRQMTLPMPLINANHAAVFLILSAASAAILAVTTTGRKAGMVYRAIVVACLAGVLATGSNAAIALMVGSVVGLMYLTRKRHNRQWRVGPELLLIIPLLITAVWVLESDVSLSDRWVIGWETALDHLGVGVGGGAFPMAASKYQTVWSSGQLTFAHNGALQAVTEWGAPVATVVGALLLAAWVSTWRAVGLNTERMIAVMAVAVVVVANQVEFSLWLPGVGLPAAALLAWAAAEVRLSARAAKSSKRRSAGPDGQKSGRKSVSSSKGRTSGVPLRVGVVATCLALLPVAAIAHEDALMPSREHARSHLVNERLEELTKLALAHPSDQNIWLHLAKLLAHRDDPRTQPAIEHALKLAPHRLEHLLLCGLNSPEPRALQCLHKVARMGPKSIHRAAALAIARSAKNGTSFSEQFGRMSGITALALADTLKSQGFDLYRRALRWAYREHPRDPTVCERLVLLWMNDPRQQSALSALSTTLFARAEEADSPDKASQLRRSAYLAMGAVTVNSDPNAAAHAFEAAARQFPQKAPMPLFRAIDIWLQVGRVDGANRLMRRLEQAVARYRLSRAERVRFHVLKSRIAQAEGRRTKAMAELRRARAYAPENDELREQYDRIRNAKENAFADDAKSASSPYELN